jgi:hypothetical protein
LTLIEIDQFASLIIKLREQDPSSGPTSLFWDNKSVLQGHIGDAKRAAKLKK